MLMLCYMKKSALFFFLRLEFIKNSMHEYGKSHNAIVYTMIQNANHEQTVIYEKNTSISLLL